MSKTMKTMIGADLDLSNHEFVSWPFKHHLLPEEITVGANVTNSPASASSLGSPVGSTGEALNLVFVYPSFFTSESIMDGAIEGQVIARMLSLASVSSSYTMYLTNIYITLFKYKADGTMEDIIPETSIWSGSVSLTGNSTEITKDVPVFFSFDVEDKMTTDALLALKVRLYGYRSAVVSMFFQLLCSPTDGDLKITIPFVEEE